jgi:hypothetical protein
MSVVVVSARLDLIREEGLRVDDAHYWPIVMPAQT